MKELRKISIEEFEKKYPAGRHLNAAVHYDGTYGYIFGSASQIIGFAKSVKNFEYIACMF